MSDPRRYYDDRKYFCPECLNVLRWQSRADTQDSLILVHPDFDRQCSRAGLRYYPPAIELTLFPADEPAKPAARPQPPWSTFTGPTCKGSIELGSACGRCEKCEWERNLARMALPAAP